MKAPVTVVSPFMTVEEAALYCRRCVDTIQAMCRDGRLPARKRGKSWLILRADVDAYLGITPPQPTLLRAVE